ncbi:LON peptidase substrate-binding domain-containing protein [Rhodospirillum sp. A1_3_36]|uniref:LON peptidase substrate-binding domain-containing protein n=1 Tax=Rhodospirillum sp. A1_3_36 TaxID=3391666 RepID=UPI0039A763FC
MSGQIFQPRFQDLPREVAVFPLSGALLLPTGTLPLNIFEPRYLAMVLDALGQGRMFAMVEPKDPDQDPSPLHGVACLGRIVSFSETNDGRLMITLQGLSRLRVVEEIEGKEGYRRIRADYGPYADDLNPPPKALGLDRDGFLESLKAYAGTHGLTFNWSAIQEVPDSALVTALCMACPFEVAEKQALLESETARDRADLLYGLLRMGAATSFTGGATQ